MFWNYRIVKDKDWYSLCEVYYNDDWAKPFMRTEGVAACGETETEVIEVLEMMLSDAKKSPVINAEDIKEENEYDSN